MTRIVQLANGEQAELDSQSLGEGGSGEVYRIVKPARLAKSHCAKIYFQKLITPELQDKIEFQADNPPTTQFTNDKFCLCWPEYPIYDNGQFCGFIMPMAFDDSTKLQYLVKRYPVHNTAPDNIKEQYSRDTIKGAINRLALCVNLAGAVHAIHHSQHKYVLLDIKPENFLITDDCRVSVIDLDNVQIIKNGQLAHSGDLATPDYTPPEGQSGKLDPKKDVIPQSWDSFSLAVLFYQVFYGVHPYDAKFSGQYKNISNIPPRIRHGLFPFSYRGEQYFEKLPEDLHKKFEQSPFAVKKLFEDTFDVGHSFPDKRPTAEMFGKVLFEQYNQLKKSPSLTKMGIALTTLGATNNSVQQPQPTKTKPVSSGSSGNTPSWINGSTTPVGNNQTTTKPTVVANSTTAKNNTNTLSTNNNSKNNNYIFFTALGLLVIFLAYQIGKNNSDDSTNLGYFQSDEVNAYSQNKTNSTSTQAPKPVTTTADSPSKNISETTINDCFYVSASAANIRSAPVSGSVIESALQGQKICAFKKKTAEDGNIWYQIKYNNKTGWVANSVVSSSEPAYKIEEIDECFFVATQEANVRNEANTKSPVKWTADRNQRVCATLKKSSSSRDNTWYKLEYGEDSGWISASVLSIGKVSEPVAPQTSSSNKNKIQVVKNLYQTSLKREENSFLRADEYALRRYATPDLNRALDYRENYSPSSGYRCGWQVSVYPGQDFPTDDFNTRGNTYAVKKINGKELVVATFAEYPSMGSVYYEVVCDQQTCKINDLFRINSDNELVSEKRAIYEECL